jgi:serine/threonine-protein kinase
VVDASRWCPLCVETTTSELCPRHRVPTIDRALDLSARHELEPGAIIAERFRIRARVGDGAVGVVFAAEQLGMNREVAIKVLKKEHITDEDSIRRFYVEAQAASSLVHPGIVRILDFGLDPKTSVPYLAMDLVEGGSLAEILAQGPIEERRMAQLFAQIASALVEAHAKGIIHRDLKPHNVLVSRLVGGQELVRVGDFGLAKIGERRSEKSRATIPGSALGTPLYMSPEQCQGLAVDFASDLYSLGCMLQEALSGHPPFERKDVVTVLAKHMRAAPPPIPTASRAMQALVSALLQKLPRRRPKSTSTVARILDALARNEAIDVAAILAGEEEKDPAPAKRRLPRLAIALVIASAAAGATVVVAAFTPKKTPAVRSEIARESPTPAPNVIAHPSPKHLRTIPPGADVFGPNARLGQTPLDVDVGPIETSSIALTIKKAGFQDRRIWVSSTGAETIVVPLEPIPTRRHALSKSKPSPGADSEGLPVW